MLNFKTFDIILLVPNRIKINSIGEEDFTYSEQLVKGVLISPASTEDLKDQDFRDKAVIAVDFPKTFTASLGGCKICWNNRKFTCVGDPLGYEGSPLPWNRRVLAYEVS